MVALAFGERSPGHVGAPDRGQRRRPRASDGDGLAQRPAPDRALRDCSGGGAAEGLELARALAMATYRSAARNSRRASAARRARDGGRFCFPVEEYLFARGRRLRRRATGPSPSCACRESIDLHRVDAGAHPRCRRRLVAVREDQLVPLEDMRALAAPAARGRAASRSVRSTATTPS